MENKRNGAFRKKKVYFTQVSNNALRDNTISLKAKGLYALIESYITLEDFTLYKSFLKKQCKEGEKAFENTWKELKDNGYLIQYRLQDPKNKQFYYEYELLDKKNIELANEIHSNQNRKKHEEKSHNPKKEGMGKNQKAIPTKREGMGNGYDGKVGVYNNTNSTNTNLNNTTSSSSSNLLEEFETNICELKKTTTDKLNFYIEKFDKDFIATIINYCCETNIKSFAGFKTVIDSYISKNIFTREDLLLDIEKFRRNKKQRRDKKNSNASTKKYNKNNNFVDGVKKDSFNSYKQREYDYDELEKRLLNRKDELLDVEKNKNNDFVASKLKELEEI